MRTSWGELADATRGRILVGEPSAAPTGVSIDSRSPQAGDCFFAIRGPHHDGHRFVEAAAATGAGLVVVDDESAANALPESCPALLVEDTTRALRFVFRLVPSFCLGDGLVHVAMLPAQRDMGITGDTALSMDVAGWDVVYLVIMFPAYLAAAVAHDFPEVFCRWRGSPGSLPLVRPSCPDSSLRLRRLLRRSLRLRPLRLSALELPAIRLSALQLWPGKPRDLDLDCNR